MHDKKYLKPYDSKADKVWVLIQYASRCCEAEGNLAGTISWKLVAFSTFIGWRRAWNSPPQHQCLRARSKALLGATLRQGRPARCVFRCLGGCC